jgi:hypothetical protein
MGCLVIALTVASCFAWFQVSMVGFWINIAVSVIVMIISATMGTKMQFGEISQEEVAGMGCWGLLMLICNLVGIVWWAVRYYGG